MSGSLYNQLVDLGIGESSSEAPSLGGLSNKGSGSPFPPNTQVKYYTANLSDESSRLMLQHLMTVSLRCQGALKNVGEVIVLSETGTFDKDGCYNIMIKYLELCSEPAELIEPIEPAESAVAI